MLHQRSLGYHKDRSGRLGIPGLGTYPLIIWAAGRGDDMPVRQGAGANADDIGAPPLTQLAQEDSQAGNHVMCRVVILSASCASALEWGQ
jgi:hypothetical protein